MLGNSLNESLIAEGEDVYMECGVNANPVAEILGWIFDVSSSGKWVFNYLIILLQGEELSQNKSSGIVIAGTSLAMQGRK